MKLRLKMKNGKIQEIKEIENFRDIRPGPKKPQKTNIFLDQRKITRFIFHDGKCNAVIFIWSRRVFFWRKSFLEDIFDTRNLELFECQTH